MVSLDPLGNAVLESQSNVLQLDIATLVLLGFGSKPLLRVDETILSSLCHHYYSMALLPNPLVNLSVETVLSFKLIRALWN